MTLDERLNQVFRDIFDDPSLQIDDEMTADGELKQLLRSKGAA